MIESVAPALQKNGSPRRSSRCAPDIAELKKALPGRDAAADAGEGLTSHVLGDGIAHRARRRQVDVRHGERAAQRFVICRVPAGSVLRRCWCGALLAGRRARHARAAGNDLAALKDGIPAAGRRCRFPPINPLLGRETRARRHAVPRQAAVGRRQPLLRKLSRSRQGLLRRRVQGDRRAGPAAHAPHADPVEPRLGMPRCSGTAVRAASRSRFAGPIDRTRRDGAADRSAHRRLAADPTIRQAFAEGLPAAPNVDADNLAKAIATYERTCVSPVDPVRSLGRGRRCGPDTSMRCAGFRLFTGKAGCAQLPQGLGLHRLCLLRHRHAGRRPRPRRGAAARGRRACLQDARTARDRPLGALHARRLAGDA